jgi:hypothetical protein
MLNALASRPVNLSVASMRATTCDKLSVAAVRATIIPISYQLLNRAAVVKPGIVMVQPVLALGPIKTTCSTSVSLV